MKRNIRDEIVKKRQTRVAALGYSEGVVLPARRETPLVPFMGGNGLICEVKRRSPSRGDIAPDLDAVAQAGIYVAAGAGNLSVLTEPEGFAGCLTDLVRVKKAFPGTAVLRKDFLFAVEDIRISFLAGADAVLLIAGMLSVERLRALYNAAKEYGMAALVEIHDQDDIRKVAAFKPELVGINCRDLTSFAIDPLLPVRVGSGVDWEAKLVYESGISHEDQAAFATGAGFDGILVGEGVVRESSLAARLLVAMRGAKRSRFWPEIGKRLQQNRENHEKRGRPLVKICGLAREDDARKAVACGADVLGFVFWPHSPRVASPELARALRDLPLPKVGVVVNPDNARRLQPEVLALLEEGVLDAVQLHGDESPAASAALWPVQYKALRPAGPDAVSGASLYRCPRVLLDAWADVPGGAGKQVDAAVLKAWQRPLWLAGGITPGNVREIAGTHMPEMIDVASGVEESPGIKSLEKMKHLFAELDLLERNDGYCNGNEC